MEVEVKREEWSGRGKREEGGKGCVKRRPHTRPQHNTKRKVGNKKKRRVVVKEPANTQHNNAHSALHQQT